MKIPLIKAYRCFCQEILSDLSATELFGLAGATPLLQHRLQTQNRAQQIRMDMKTVRVVAAVIRKENAIFATARGYGAFKGGWEFPGGKIEAGESARQALVREIREELDTEVEVGDLIETVEYDYPDFHLSMDCFWCRIVSGELVLKEALESRWLTRETLDTVPWLPADLGLIAVIKRLLPA